MAPVIAHLAILMSVQFSALEDKVIHGMFLGFGRSAVSECALTATEFWTANNIADGLNALTICVEVRTARTWFVSTVTRLHRW